MLFKAKVYKCCVCLCILKSEDQNYLLSKINNIKVNRQKDTAEYNITDSEPIEWFCPRCFEKYLNILECYKIETRKYWDNKNRFKGVKNEDRVKNKVNHERENEN